MRAPTSPSPELASRIEREVSVERLAEAHGVTLVADGGQLRGPCPFHRDCQLVIDRKANTWACRQGEGSEGSAVEWVMAAKKLPWPQAVEWLRAGLFSASEGDLPASTEPLDPDLDDEALLHAVVDHYQRALLASPEAREFLARRGLGHPDLIDVLHLGFSDRTLGYRMQPTRWKAGRKLRGQLQRLGVLRDTGHETLRGSLVVPVFDLQARVLDAYGRKVGQRLRKGTALHTRWHDPPRGIWNHAALAGFPEILVAKSVMDGLTWWCHGFRNVVVGEPEALASEVQAHNVQRVLVAFDRSEQSHDRVKRFVEVLTPAGVEIFALRLPGEHDANALACAANSPQAALATLVRGAEWVGRGTAPVMEAVPLAAPSSSPEAIEPPASPMPEPPAPEPDLDSAEHEVRVRYADRHWRVRGLGRNTTYDRLHVNLMVRRGEVASDPRLAGYHLDTLDLYSAKHRSAFARAAAAELAVEEATVNRDLGRLLLRLEELQDDAIQKALEPHRPAVEIPEEERAEALALLQSPDLLERIVRDFARCGVVGEETNKLVGYLAAVSRKLDDPLALLIQSSSAAGKTTLLEAILAFVPEEDRLAFSSITGQAAYYFAGGDLRHKILAIAEEQGAARARYALKLLQSEGRLAIASTGKDAATGRLTSHEYVVEGPVALMLSTTSIDVDPELENRALVLEVSESRELTRAIHARQRQGETLAGLRAAAEREALLRLHQNAQRLLRPLRVVNPYADQLAFPDGATRARRDHRKYLGLIRAVTFLHQHQREVKTATHGSQPVEYIEVTREDIAAGNRLAHAVLGRSLASVPPQTRRLLRLLAEWAADTAAQQEIPPGEVRFTRRMVREHTGWGHSQLAVHLKRLEELEYLLVHPGGRSRRVYELCYGRSEDDGEARLPGLVDPASLVEPSPYDPSHPGSEATLPGPVRGTSGPFPGGFRVEAARETEDTGS